MTITDLGVRGEGDHVEPPSKRIKLSQPPPPSRNGNINAQQNLAVAAKMDDQKPDSAAGGTGFQPEREVEVGIIHFVNSSNPGFSGVLKQRYTDFLVNEIAPDGTVVHLTDDKAPKFKPVSKADDEQVQAPKGVGDTNEDHRPKAEIEDQAQAQVSRFATRDIRLEDSNFSAEIPAKAQVHVSRLATRDIRLEDPNCSFAKLVSSQTSAMPDNTSTPDIWDKDHNGVKKTAEETIRTNLLPSSIIAPSPSAPVIKDETSGVATSKDETDNENTMQAAVAPSVDKEQSANAEKPAFVISTEDDALLTAYFGANIKDQILKFHTEVFAKPDKKPSLFGSLMSDPITDREFRTKLHQDVRRIFESRIETESLNDGIIKISASVKARPRQEFNPRPGRNNQPRGKVGWQELGGQYLHFSLYKENKDTMEVISYLCRVLKIKPRDFAFSGTKDRRAVTVQRVSVFRQYADKLAQNNRNLFNARVGNFKYEKHPLELGELQGNEFLITLRGCHFGDDAALDVASRVDLATKVVGEAVIHLQEHGFLNYFGLQRFGTFGIGTDEVGKKILRGDFAGAVQAIMTVSDESAAIAQNPGAPSDSKMVNRDDIARAKAIHLFNTGVKSHAVLDILPRKFSAESAIIRHLGSHDKGKDYLGALLVINRNLRLMYVHAYQSLVWNMAASERWARYGDKIIKGDLVLVDGQAARNAAARGKEEVDENGEIIIHPAADDIAVSHDDLYQRARALTAEEADSGQHSIFDIVLPTPGYDIEYPDNDIGDFYKEFMGSERGGGLDPADMRRNSKDFSLSGSYRKLIAQVGKDLSYEIKTYHEENEQLVETDLEKLNKSRPQQQNNNPHNDQRQDNNARNNQYGRGGRQQSGRNNRVGRRGETTGQRVMYTQDLNAQQHNAWNALPAKLAAEDKAAAEVAAADRLNPKDPKDISIPTFRDTYIQTTAENGSSRRTGHRSTVIHQGTIAISAALSSDVEPKAVPPTLPPQYDGVCESKEEADTNSPAIGNVLPADPIAPVVEKKPSISSAPEFVDGSVKLKSSPEKPSKKRSAEHISIATPVIGIPEDLENQEPEESFNKDKADEEEQGTKEILDENMDMEVEAEEPPPAKIAVIIKFALGSSQYATMALRELMKAGGVKTYKPNFSGGR